jgi:hypothetical protein
MLNFDHCLDDIQTVPEGRNRAVGPRTASTVIPLDEPPGMGNDLLHH